MQIQGGILRGDIRLVFTQHKSCAITLRYAHESPCPTSSEPDHGQFGAQRILESAKECHRPTVKTSGTRNKNFAGRVHVDKAFRIAVSHWAAQDSNLRLPPCEDGTLTAELAARREERDNGFTSSFISLKNSVSGYEGQGARSRHFASK